MKKILVSTDFSDAATNAVSYAAELAKSTGSGLTLIHVYHTPPVVTEVPLVIPPLEEIERECLEKLKQIEKKLVLHYEGKVIVDVACRCGFAVDEIVDFAKETGQDLIVMGMQGSGYIAERLLGSITTSVVENTKVPVIAVGAEHIFSPLKNIVFACDFKDLTANKLAPLKDLVKVFDSELHFLNVIAEDDTESIAHKQEEADVLLGDIKHSFNVLKGENIINTINEFAASKHAQLVVMVPHHHTLFEKLRREPYTKQMAFHARVPLLALN